jgi:hypothetical protein
MKKHNTKVINFEEKWIRKACREFNDEYGTTTQELEEGYYLQNKCTYEREHDKWIKITEANKRRKETKKKIPMPNPREKDTDHNLTPDDIIVLQKK